MRLKHFNNSTLLKTLFCTLAVLVISPTLAFSQVTIGLCDNEVKPSGLNNSNTSTPISCAVCLTPEFLNKYSFCDAKSLHIGLLTPTNLTSFQLWIRQHLNDETNLVSIEIDPTLLEEGWNDFQLPETFLLADVDTLYCGYTYTQSAKTEIAGSGNKGTENGCWIGINGKWKNYSNKYPPICIKLGIFSHVPVSIKMANLQLDRRCVRVGDKDPITITGEIQNFGSEPLTSFAITWKNFEDAPETAVFSAPSIQFYESVSFQFTIVPKTKNYIQKWDTPVCIEATLPNGATDFLAYDCQDTLYYETAEYPPMGALNNLIEEFTSEQCGFAPISHQRILDAIQEGYRHMLGDRGYEAWLNWELDGEMPTYTIISHHEGYGPADAWRVTENSDYSATIFGPDQLTFAPAVQINRRGAPISSTLPADSIGIFIDGRSHANDFTFVVNEAKLTRSNNVYKVTASVSVSPWFASDLKRPKLVLLVKQDSVASVAQKNYNPDLYDASYQYDVIRCYLTDKENQGLIYNKDANMEEVMSGQSRIIDNLWTDNEGNVLTFHFEGKLPEDITTSEGLTLVGYIYDADDTSNVSGVFEHRLDRK